MSEIASGNSGSGSSESATAAVVNATASAGVVGPRFREAFERLLGELRAIPEAELAIINLDVPTTVATALGVLPELRQYRERAATLPGLDLRLFDRLGDYALALAYAHGAYLAASQPPRSLEQLAADAARLRDVLLADAGALVQRGLIDGARLTEIKSRVGYRNVAFDLLVLVNLLRERWPAISGRTGVALGELEEAEILADRLLTAVGEREQSPVTLGAASADRQRAFTAFLRAYGEARRAIAYLRFREGDADDIVPSLYVKGKRKKDDATSETEPTLPDAPIAAPPPPGGAPATAASTSAPPALRGLPGEDPFTA